MTVAELARASANEKGPRLKALLTELERRQGPQVLSALGIAAASYEDDVKEEWAAYTKANADFFIELGSPGGASKVGKTDHDPQWIKDLPPVQHDE